MTDLTQAVETAAETYWNAVVMRKLATARPWELVDPDTQQTIREELLPVVEAVRDGVIRQMLDYCGDEGEWTAAMLRRELERAA